MSQKKPKDPNNSIGSDNSFRQLVQDMDAQTINVLPVSAKGLMGQSKNARIPNLQFGGGATKRGQQQAETFEFDVPEERTETADKHSYADRGQEAEMRPFRELKPFREDSIAAQEAAAARRLAGLAAPGSQVMAHREVGALPMAEYPGTVLTRADYGKRLQFEELKKTKLEEMCHWKQKDVKGMKKNVYIKEVQKKNERILSATAKDELEQLEVMTDRFPLLELRKAVMKFVIFVNMLCKYIIETVFFDNFTTLVILVNSVMMMWNNPTDTNPDPIFEQAESVFLVLYTGEMILKILGMGFIFGKTAYLKDSFNILDFIIVLSSLAALGDEPPAATSAAGDEEDPGFSMASLRAFRVLRPLRTVSSVKGLKVLMVALISALPLLGDTLTILAGFFLTFSIAGSQILSGVLKQRCFNIQSGIKLGEEADSLCASSADCPGGYYCGKGNQNPNNGATNFDNVLYSLLAVFQTTTLEGWSDVQVMVEKSYSMACTIYFTLIVFGGAFFMLNLTLAVINSKFSEAHNAQLSSDTPGGGVPDTADERHDNELDNALHQQDAKTISQWITARIYAKKMIQFLRMRQEAKRIEHERMQRIKEKQIQYETSTKAIKKDGDSIALTNKQLYKQPSTSQGRPIQNGVIQEEDEDEDNQLEPSEQDELEKDIQDFYKNSKKQMQRLGQVSSLPKNAKRIQDPSKKNAQTFRIEPISKAPGNGQPRMKGNIGLSKTIYVNPDSMTNYQQKMFGIMAEECDIDRIIPKAAQKHQELDKTSLNVADKRSHEGSFNLSLQLDDLEGDFERSQQNEDAVVIEPTQVKRRNNRRIPGLNYDQDANKSDDSGLITSDSEFEKAAKEAGYLKSDVINLRKTSVDPTKGQTFNIRKDISKTFKRMLSSNHKRLPSAHENADYSNETSTQYGGSQAYKFENEHDRQTQLSEIESKYRRNTSKAISNQKKYKEDQDLDESYMPTPQVQQQEEDDTPFGQNKKEEIRQLQEFVSTKKPNDPFKDLEPLKEKIDITKELAYQGTSQHDVLGQRITNHGRQETLANFKFLKLPQYLEEQPEGEQEVTRQAPIRSGFEAYQQKTVYEVHEDSSDIDEGTQSTDEDVLFAAEQPYYTATNVGYNKMLKQCKIPEMMKRSDIMITSTLSMSIFPKDKRAIQNQYFAQMKEESLIDYLDERNAFNALVKEHEYQIGKVKDKEKEYKENYMKSFIHRSNFMSKTLSEFKSRVELLNTNRKQPIVKPKELQQMEKMKHQQNKTASQKRGLPRFDMETAHKLLDGKFHEDEDDDDEVVLKGDLGRSIFAVNMAELEAKNRFEQFEAALHRIFEEDANANRFRGEDEIPSAIRKHFGFPSKMGMYEPDFNKIRHQDISFKKQKPMWSGQDVLRDSLDHEKSQWVVAHVNAIRVWPTGPFGLYKRWRFYLRKMVKNPMFDNLMTLGVLLNTFVLAADHWGMAEEVRQMLDSLNAVFTWIFIFEMASKILAIGINKYTGDRMNYLDGGVVSLSIFELVMESVLAGAEGGVNLSAFKTLRMLRTFRVFRIARLLKALKSMQVIIGVIARSYMSFFYIANLMFLFIIIFSLLGTQLFGGKFGDDPETIPRGNFDSFSIAFITVFQILTMENWQSVLFDSFKSGEKFGNSIYCIVWIFLGNFILLNLFLAILLDSFLEQDDEELDEAEIAHQLQLKRQRQLDKEKRMGVNKVAMGENNERKIAKRANQPSKLYFGEKPESEEDLEDLDEDQIIAIFKDENIIQKEKSEIQKEKLYEGKDGRIECEMAFYIFGKDNKFRIFCYRAINHPRWDSTVMVLIGLSSFKLAYDAYLQELPKDHPANVQSALIDKVFNYIFIFEMSFKLIATGLIMDEGSYLRDTWNQLDFFIVMASVVDMAFSSYDLAAVKIMRMLRVLRPLRMIAHNPELKMIINALLDSVGSIMNVLIVIAVVYLIFAIIGVNLFKGKFYYCSIDIFKIHTAQECEMNSGQWQKYDFNYDNAIAAMETLYVVSSLEGWPDIMIQTIDMVDYEQGPQKEYSRNMYWYYILFIFIGSFFFLNFFIGVLFLKFTQAQKEDRKGFTDKDLGWMDIQKLILTAEPDYETTNVPQNKYIREFHDLVSSSSFKKFIMVCIVLNIVQMALNAENMSPFKIALLDFAGYVFTVIFLGECILKLIAYRKTYFKDSWNQFDFVVVSSSIFDIFMQLLENIEADLSALSSLTQLARVARIMRVTRILKLAGKDPGLQAILQTVQFSIPSLANVGTLLVLIYFMFAVLGNFLFYPVKTGDVIDPVYKNFDGFLNSFLLVFALSTGEDWNKVMYDCNRTPDSANGCIEGQTCGQGGPVGFWYFYLIVLLCSHVMLNLFILVIIEQFEHYYLADNIIGHFKNDLTSFMSVWQKFTQDRYQCKKIKENMLTDFFRKLGEYESKEESLGFSEEHYDGGELKKQLLKMGIKSNQGFIYFNELLYRCMRKKYGSMKINKKMQIFELKNQIKIYEMGKAMQNLGHTKTSNEEIRESIIAKGNGVNPFIAVMNFKISIKTWIKHARMELRRLQREKQQALDLHSHDPISSLSHDDEGLQQTIGVEIEVEEYVSETSEEETTYQSQGTYRRMGGGGSASGSHGGSMAELHNSQHKEKKKVDHLKLFQRKMTAKFKAKAGGAALRQNLETAMKRKSYMQRLAGAGLSVELANDPARTIS